MMEKRKLQKAKESSVLSSVYFGKLYGLVVGNVAK